MTLLTYWSIAWVFGIWLGSIFAIPTLLLAAGAAVTLLLAAVLSSYATPRLILSCVALIALGSIRYAWAQPTFDEHSLSSYNDQGWVTLEGVVAAEPDVRASYAFYKLDAQHLALADEDGAPFAVHGAVRVRGPRYPLFDYGDRLQVQGLLEEPPAWMDFNYRDFLANRGIYSQISYAQIQRLADGGGSAWKRGMLELKARAQETIAEILPEPEASLLTGILLGVEGGIPQKMQDAFSATGTAHVIAISGFNMAIVAGLLMATLGRLLPNRRLAGAVAILGVVAYTLFVGASAAVVRAAIMGSIVVLAVIVGRKGVALNSLAAATLIMSAINPYVLWDVGFQLSVAATLGLIIYGERFERAIQKLLERKLPAPRARWLVHWISEMLLLTLAAQILVTPLILKYFGQLSAASLLSNALILPFQPPIMVLGGAAAISGVAFTPLGQVVAWGAYLPLTWTTRAVQWTAQLPYASIPITLSDLGLVTIYGAIAGLTGVALLSPERRKAFLQSVRSQFPFKVAASTLILVMAVTWLAISQLPDKKLHVHFMDVGQGDAIFIETPSGAQILIDGGPEGNTLLSTLGRRMPFWDRTLDLVVLTHPDEDHLTGLIAALERYDVSALLLRQYDLDSDLVDTWKTTVEEEDARLISGEAGTHIAVGDGVSLDILHPGSGLPSAGEGQTNNDSIVIRLVYGDVAVLLPGDIEADVERQLVNSGIYMHSTVLKVPHHGSMTSSCRAFLDAVTPQLAVISVGENTFGHPAQDVLDRLQGTRVFRTDEDGTVSVASDGHTLWVETER